MIRPTHTIAFMAFANFTTPAPADVLRIVPLPTEAAKHAQCVENLLGQIVLGDMYHTGNFVSALSEASSARFNVSKLCDEIHQYSAKEAHEADLAAIPLGEFSMKESLYRIANALENMGDEHDNE